MARVRGRFEGVTNVVRFNWHFYALSAVFAIFLFIAGRYFDSALFYVFGAVAIILALVSLGVTYYVYDLSNLYSLDWLDGIEIKTDGKLICLNAGFDETSGRLRQKYPDSEVGVYDFYDPKTQTEVSIKRARNMRSGNGNAKPISVSDIPVADNSTDAIFVIFAAHEIRNDRKRMEFFSELARVLKGSGKIIVTEHLRNAPNLIAYNLGGLHFLSRSTWNSTFEQAGLQVSQELNITPFVTTFVLKKNGSTS